MSPSKLTPTPVQVNDGAFLARQVQAAMFSEPGTGKTLTAISAYQEACEGERLLVAAPPIALRMWEENLTRQLGVKVQRIKSGKDRLDPEATAVVVSYDRALRMMETLKTGEFVAAVLDESDALKTLSSSRTRAFYGNRAQMNGAILSEVTYVWPLTGTPIRRYADDIYPQLKALHPQVLQREGIGTLEAFRNRFCVSQLRSYHPRQRPQMVVMANRDEEGLRSLIYDNGLARRRLLADIAEFLPPLSVKTVDVSFDDSEALKQASAEAAYAGEADAVMATARRLLGIAKAPYVAKYARDVIAGLTCPVLLMYWHKEAGDILHQDLTGEGYRVMRIDGSSSVKQKEAAEDAFNAGDIDFLLGQIQSMGVALNLQAGSHYCIFAERDWSPASQEQAIARLRRMGQKHKVIADICEAQHPIDEAVDIVNERKVKSTAKVVG